MSSLREKLLIAEDRWHELNRIIMDPNCRVVNELLEVVEKFGGPEAINRKAAAARRPEALKDKLKETGSPYLADIQWLEEQAEGGTFVSFEEYCADRGGQASNLNTDNAVTMEISPMLYFPWIMAEARRAIAERELMPGRVVRLRNMQEQCADQPISSRRLEPEAQCDHTRRSLLRRILLDG